MSGDVHVRFCERLGVKSPWATHLAVLGRAPAAVMLAAVEALMKRLKLAMNVEKTRCCRVPEESMTFLGYRIGCNYRPAYKAIDQHATRRLRQWLCRKHKVRTGKHVRFPSERLWSDYGLTHLAPRTASFPWAKA